MKGEKALDSSKQKGTRKGCDPAVYVASFLFGFAGGGAGMADFGRLNDEAGLKEFPGVKRFPDETTSGEWPREPPPKVWTRIRTLLHILMPIPVRFKHHARQLKAVRCVSGCWLRWWNRFITELTADGADVPPARGSSLKPDHPPCIRPDPEQLKPVKAPQRHGPIGRIHAPGRGFHPRK